MHSNDDEPQRFCHVISAVLHMVLLVPKMACSSSRSGLGVQEQEHHWLAGI